MKTALCVKKDSCYTFITELRNYLNLCTISEVSKNILSSREELYKKETNEDEKKLIKNQIESYNKFIEYNKSLIEKYNEKTQDFYMISRDICEIPSNGYIQFIPYLVIFTYDPSNPLNLKILHYLRSSKGNENRLHNKTSCGIGGHIDKEDLYVDGEVYLTIPGFVKICINSAKRELKEELDIDATEIGGLELNDLYFCVIPNATTEESDEVDTVHAGLVIYKYVDYYKFDYLISKANEYVKNIDQYKNDVDESLSAHEIKEVGTMNVKLEEFFSMFLIKSYIDAFYGQNFWKDIVEKSVCNDNPNNQQENVDKAYIMGFKGFIGINKNDYEDMSKTRFMYDMFDKFFNDCNLENWSRIAVYMLASMAVVSSIISRR